VKTWINSSIENDLASLEVNKRLDVADVQVIVLFCKRAHKLTQLTIRRKVSSIDETVFRYVLGDVRSAKVNRTQPLLKL
jgi:hypothetical protein